MNVLFGNFVEMPVFFILCLFSVLCANRLDIQRDLNREWKCYSTCGKHSSRRHTHTHTQSRSQCRRARGKKVPQRLN